MLGFVWVVGAIAVGVYGYQKNDKRTGYALLVTFLSLIISPFLGFPFVWLHLRNNKADGAVETPSPKKRRMSGGTIALLVLLGLVGLALYSASKNLLKSAEERKATYEDNKGDILDTAQNLRKEGCEIIRSNAFLKQAYCAAGTESYQAKEFGMDTCGGDRSCNVWIWTNRQHLPKAMMMTDAEVGNAAYVWIGGTATLNECKKTGC